MQDYTLGKSIKFWAEDERPREKLLQKGAAALSDAELLAILISSGTRERSALDLARDVLTLAHNHLHELGRLSIKEMQAIKGIGEARAILVSAAMELGRRRQLAEGMQRTTVQGSAEAAQIILPLLSDLTVEHFCVLYMNQAGRLIRYETISEGGIAGTVADIRVILKQGLLYGAAQMIVAHNHPSGNLSPSQADRTLTQKLKEAAAVMDIKLLDHLIIGGNKYLSFADEGYM